MSLIDDYGGADFLDLDALKSFAEFCYNKGHDDGINDAVEELFSKSSVECLKVHDKLVQIDTINEFLRRAISRRFTAHYVCVDTVEISELKEIAEDMKRENK